MLDNEIVLHWEDRGLTGTLNIPSARDPFVEKEEYFVSITLSNDMGKEANFRYKVENALEHIPALCLEGVLNMSGVNGFCYGIVNTSFSHALYPYMRLRNITSNITFTLIDSSGDTDVFNVFTDTPYGADCIEIQDLAAGRSDDSSVGVMIESDLPIFMGERDTYTDATIEAVIYQYDAAVQGVLMTEIAVAGDYDNIDQAINSFEEDNTISRSQRYYINNVVRRNGVVVANKRYEFMILPGAKIGFVADTPHESEGLTYNMGLRLSGFPFQYREGGTGDSWSEGTAITILNVAVSRYYYGEWTDYANGDYYKATCATNIPIWKNQANWENYVAGDLTEEDAENAGDILPRHPTTGEDLDSSDISSPEVAGSGIGCNVFALSKSDLTDIADVLYDDDQTVIDDIQKGTWLWGNNPMDFIISCYYVPFDVSDFYDLITGDVYFGSYDSGLDKSRVLKNTSSNRLTLCNTPIESVYGDYRDITLFKYEIYLPFVGFVPLDINAFLDKMLKVEMSFDIMTHNIRYYIYADGIIQERIDGSVGYDIPLMATDQVNKAKSDLQGMLNLVDVAKDSFALSAAPSVGGLEAIASDSLKAYASFKQKPTAKVIGNVSSCMNIYDIRYVYLKITETGNIKPKNLNAIYNYPSYYIGNSSALSGYCEISDIQLSCNATEEEIEEIKNLLRGGAIF